MERFRILSLDGGGVKGTFTAAVLAELETLSGQRLVEHFDLITGTSTGGIIALALGLELSAADILQFYCTQGRWLFPSTGVARRLRAGLRQLLRPKYSARVLHDALAAVLGRRTLGEARCRLVVPSYDAVRGDVHVFRTAHTRGPHAAALPAVDVAMATAAAPTYWPAWTVDRGCHLDGGLWANCPVTVGLVEAIGVLGQAPSAIDVLSIGTTTEPFAVSPRRRARGGLLRWNTGLLDLLQQAQVAAALAQAQTLTGHTVLRLNVVTQPHRFRLDDARQIDELRALGLGEARQWAAEVQRRFLTAPAAPFVPG